jgi:hypothetical protein
MKRMTILGGYALAYRFAVNTAVAALAVVMLSHSSEYSPEVRAFPVMASWAMLMLILLDVLVRSKFVRGCLPRFIAGEGSVNSEGIDQTKKQNGRRIAFALGWIPFYVVLVYLVGFLLTAVIYTFISMTILGNARPLTGAVWSLGHALSLWFFFEAIFGFHLYSGILGAALQAWS